jgi:hypothetical protein
MPGTERPPNKSGNQLRHRLPAAALAAFCRQRKGPREGQQSPQSTILADTGALNATELDQFFGSVQALSRRKTGGVS